MPLFIVRNSILNMEVDAIVNSTRPELLGGGRMDGLIHAAAGPQLDEECQRIGHCDVGKAVITRGYSLPFRYIIHTVGPVWTGGTNHEEEDLISCYKESLILALRHECASVALPLISSGFYGYPKELALRCAVDTIKEFLEYHEMEIYLVVFDRTAYQISQDLFSDVRAYIDDHYVEEVKKDYWQGAGNYPAPGTYSRPAFSSRPREEDASEYFEEELSGLPEVGQGYSERMESVSAPKPLEKKGKRHGALSDIFEKRKKRSVKDSSPVVTGKPVFDYRTIELDESFSQMLLRLIDEKEMTDSECYKKANIDRKLFSKIRSNPYYNPSKYTAVAFAIALELDYEQTQELLSKAGLTLSHSNMFDVIVEYFIVRRKYDIFEINEVLFEFDQKLLGAAK